MLPKKITRALICVSFFICSCSNTRHLRTAFYDESKETNLYAFVGEKITIEPFDPNKDNETKVIDSITGREATIKRSIMDLGFDCRYKVLQRVFNNPGSDTISFKAYDHYGRPKFEKYDYVLLYINKNDKSNFDHLKYQFDPLKKKNDGFSGLHGESLKSLFERKKRNVLKSWGIFK